MRIVRDIPLLSINDDELRRDQIVKLIVESINNLVSSDHSCTIYGIYGKWGDGKTSLLNFIKNRLSEQGESDGIKVVDFNPWLINNDETLLHEFFNIIMTDIDEEARSVLKRYGSLAILASKTVVNTFVPGAGEVLGSGIEMLQKVFEDSKETLAELKKSASKSIAKSKRHLIVMIDDVDRLDKEELHSVLRLIRQIADFDNCIYFVAMDDDLVAKSIGDYYGTVAVQDGHKFLDKIVQIPIKLPKIPVVDMEKIVKRELTKTLSAYVDMPMIEEISAKVAPMMHTYRDLKRYCNQLVFVLPYMVDEVNIKDLCILEAIKVISTEAYDRIHTRRSQLIGDLMEEFPFNINQDETGEKIKVKYEEALNWVVENLSEDIKSVIRKVVDELFSNNLIISQMDIDNKRISTNVYFPKYFALDVPSDLIPDKDIAALNEAIEKGRINDVAAQFNEWIKIFPNTEIKRAALYYFRDKMQKNEGCRVASVLAKSLSICKLAENYPKNINVDSNSIATFVSLIIILKYMFQQDSMDGRIKVIDSKLLNETLDFIFLKAELNYCLSVLSSSDEIICIDANIGKDALFTLIKRFRKLSIREQMTYSRFLLVMLFKYWQRTDAVSFNEYANAFVSNKNMSLMDVFDK